MRTTFLNDATLLFLFLVSICVWGAILFLSVFLFLFVPLFPFRSSCL